MKKIILCLLITLLSVYAQCSQYSIEEKKIAGGVCSIFTFFNDSDNSSFVYHVDCYFRYLPICGITEFVTAVTCKSKNKNNDFYNFIQEWLRKELMLLQVGTDTNLELSYDIITIEEADTFFKMPSDDSVDK